MVSLTLKVILHVAVNDSKYRDVAPLNPLLSDGKGKIALDKLSCKTATSFFVNKKFVVPTAEKWLKKAGLDEQTIHQIYKLPFNVTNNGSLSNFQFKIVHYILPTNYSLCRDNIKDSDMWHLCGERQTITQLFVTCPNVQVFWADFEQWWNNKNNDSIKLSKTWFKPLHYNCKILHPQCCKE